jgi:hypothetical protein
MAWPDQRNTFAVSTRETYFITGTLPVDSNAVPLAKIES